MNFTPDENYNILDTPYIEDTRASITPNYTTRQLPEKALTKISEEMIKMGAHLINIISGNFEIAEQQRIGYVIRFSLGGHVGEIRVAGLPMRKPTTAKERQVRAQALLTVANMLEIARVSRIFNPDAHPLVPYLLVDEGRTVAQAFEEKRLKLLDSGE